MRLLIIVLVPTIWLAVGAALIVSLSPVPIIGPALTNALRRYAKALRWFSWPMQRLRARSNSGHEIRITALEKRNVALEMQVAELTSCILRSLAIALETQQHLEIRGREEDPSGSEAPRNRSCTISV
jgi:hypothetical protein